MFEFDPDKSALNKQKHGIDFEEAQALWQDGKLLFIEADSGTEVRFLAVGMMGELHWSAVCTMRDENVRLISVRRARKDEVQLYENQ
jgi:uncharacterized protein